MPNVLDIIDAEAKRDHVDPALARAIAKIETGGTFDPRSQGDHGYFMGGRFVADPNGPATSFGLYQLHQGGMLGTLTPAQAFNPQINAHVALTHLYKTEQGHPDVHDPGTLAALSQGPADPKGYAEKINLAIIDAGGRIAGAPSIGSVAGSAAGAVGNAAGAAGGFVWNVVTGTWDVVKSPFELAGKIWGALTSGGTWIRVGLFVGGVLLVLLGLYKLFSGGSGAVPVPIPV